MQIDCKVRDKLERRHSPVLGDPRKFDTPPAKGENVHLNYVANVQGNAILVVFHAMCQ